MLSSLRLIVLTVSLAACAFQPTSVPTTGNPKPEFTTCPEQRPNVCTMDYRPVCATRDTGVRCVTTPCPSTEHKTYSNACGACADTKVIGHIPDECPTLAPDKQ
jgi:hypothetical protein